MLVQHKEIPAVTTNGIIDSKEFKIPPSKEIFRILSSGMYSDVIAAIIRELSCNAWDAHQDNNNSKKQFDVELPGRFHPLFRLRDYGPGLSHEDVMDLYVSYGGSTKRERNDQIGALGLGSKSPLGYTQSFSVVSYHKGHKRVYSVYIGDEDSINPGFPNIAFTGQTTTDELDGIEISIPTQEYDYDKWETAARKIYKWFPLLPNFINNDKMVIERPEVKRVIKSISITQEEGGYYSTWNIIQGNICYPLEFSAIDYSYRELFKQMSGFITVPIGGVTMSPSRESLTYDEPTVKTIEDAFTEFEKVYVESFLKEINEAETYTEAYLLQKEINSSNFLKKSELVTKVIADKVNESLNWLYDDATGPTTLGNDDIGLNGRFERARFNPAVKHNRDKFSLDCVSRIFQLATQGHFHTAVAESEVVMYNIKRLGRRSNSSKYHKLKRVDKDYKVCYSEKYATINDFHVIWNDGTRSSKSVAANYLRHEQDFPDDDIVICINKCSDNRVITELINFLVKYTSMPLSNVIRISAIPRTPSTYVSTGNRVSKVARLHHTKNGMRWDKGIELQLLIDDPLKVYYWFTSKNVTPQDLNKDPKSFLTEMKNLVGLNEIYGVKAKDVPSIKGLSNWIHCNDAITPLITQKVTKEAVLRFAYFFEMNKLSKWCSTIKDAGLEDTIKHKGLKKLVVANIRPMVSEGDRSNIRMLINFAKRESITVPSIPRTKLAEKRERLYNSIIGIKLIVEGDNYPNFSKVKEFIRLANHFSKEKSK